MGFTTSTAANVISSEVISTSVFINPSTVSSYVLELVLRLCGYVKKPMFFESHD